MDRRAFLAASAATAAAVGAKTATADTLPLGPLPEMRYPDVRIESADLVAAANLLARLATALAPLELIPAEACRLKEIANRHREVVAALCGGGSDGAWATVDEHGSALAAAFDEITTCPPAGDLVVAPEDYADLFRALIADRVLRQHSPSDARILILGPLEARLQSFDTVILGGLVEGSWPPEIPSDPWLSRPLRRELGLDLPERRIGLSAHDFAQLFGARAGLRKHIVAEGQQIFSDVR